MFIERPEKYDQARENRLSVGCECTFAPAEVLLCVYINGGDMQKDCWWKIFGPNNKSKQQNWWALISCFGLRAFLMGLLADY